MTSPIGSWTNVLKPQVWEPEVTIFGREGGAGEVFLIGSD